MIRSRRTVSVLTFSRSQTRRALIGLPGMGYSWGGVVGLQLATRTDRLTALICGGWPPLGAPYKGMVDLLEAQTAEHRGAAIYATFYRSIADWPERNAVSRFTCPRMTFAGSNDILPHEVLTTRIGPLVAEYREELEEMGWTVELVEGFSHDLFTRADVVVPMIRKFLDPVLLP